MKPFFKARYPARRATSAEQDPGTLEKRPSYSDILLRPRRTERFTDKQFIRHAFDAIQTLHETTECDICQAIKDQYGAVYNPLGKTFGFFQYTVGRIFYDFSPMFSERMLGHLMCALLDEALFRFTYQVLREPMPSPGTVNFWYDPQYRYRIRYFYDYIRSDEVFEVPPGTPFLRELRIVFEMPPLVS